MMIAAAVCPHPPLLLSELVSRRPAPVEELAEACALAVRWLVGHFPDAVVVVGAGDATRAYDADAAFLIDRFTGRGPDAADQGLPLSLGVGARLLDEAGWSGPRRFQSLGADLAAGHCASIGQRLGGELERIALLVMGDGSARRGPKAPGYLDPRAAAFDAEVSSALGAGDAGALLHLDPALAESLLVQGRAAWQALAGAAGAAPVDTELLYSGDPYGVHYVVSTWAPVSVA